jgi:hypothetical protein
MRRVPCLLVLLALSPCLWPATVVVNRLAYVPAHFVVGKEAEAYALVSIDGGEGEAFTAKAGSGLPSPSAQADPELRGLSLQKGSDGWELRIRFIAWSPGKGKLPGLEVRGYSIPALPYEVESVLGPEDNEPAPPKPQLDPPGTALYLYGFVGFVILLGFLVFAFVAYLLPAAKRLLEKRKAAEARRALGKRLAWLGKELDDTPSDAFYAVLSRAIRLYLAERVLPEATALTSREFSLLSPDRFPAQGLKEEATALLFEAEAVRYSGEAADEARKRASLARAAKLGDAAEEALA